MEGRIYRVEWQIQLCNLERRDLDLERSSRR